MRKRIRGDVSHQLATNIETQPRMARAGQDACPAKHVLRHVRTDQSSLEDQEIDLTA
jgi:hypothetical protein